MQTVPSMKNSPCGLPLFTYLDASTAHIHMGDCRLLAWSARYFMSFGLNSRLSPPTAIVYPKDCGFFVHVCHDASGYEENFKKAGYSEAFLHIFRQALEAGASWICFDVDGSVSERLPVLPHE